MAREMQTTTEYPKQLSQTGFQKLHKTTKRIRHRVGRGSFDIQMIDNNRRSILQQSTGRRIQCVGNYDLQATLGHGQFGKVKLAIHALTGEKVAVKIISKKKLDKEGLEGIKREVSILKKLNHPNIIRLFEVIETEAYLFIITEYACGGEIMDYILKKKLSEDKSRQFFRQIISALFHIHNMGFVHRDLKLENILLDENLNIKIIDFGFASCFSPTHFLQTFCGSPSYASPELILRQQYIGPEVDIWSAGVVLYTLMAGTPPFQASDMLTLYRKIVNCDFIIPENFSHELCDLIRSIFISDIKKRIQLNEIIKHDWMIGSDQWQCPKCPISFPSISSDQVDDSIISQLVKFGYNKDCAIKAIHENQFDSISATLRLMIGKRQRSEEIQIQNNDENNNNDRVDDKYLTKIIPIDTLNINNNNELQDNGDNRHTLLDIKQSYISGFVSMPTSASNSPSTSQFSSPIHSLLNSPRHSCDFRNHESLFVIDHQRLVDKFKESFPFSSSDSQPVACDDIHENNNNSSENNDECMDNNFQKEEEIVDNNEELNNINPPKKLSSNTLDRIKNKCKDFKRSRANSNQDDRAPLTPPLNEVEADIPDQPERRKNSKEIVNYNNFQNVGALRFSNFISWTKELIKKKN